MFEIYIYIYKLIYNFQKSKKLMNRKPIYRVIKS